MLQDHDKVSDAEAKAGADFDIRRKVALGIEIEERPFARSAFRAGPGDRISMPAEWRLGRPRS